MEGGCPRFRYAYSSITPYKKNLRAWITGNRNFFRESGGDAGARFLASAVDGHEASPVARLTAAAYVPRRNQNRLGPAHWLAGHSIVATFSAISSAGAGLEFHGLGGYPHGMIATSYRYIVQRVGVRSGQPVVEGTRIGVHDVVAMIKTGASVDAVVGSLPRLTRAQVYECLAYYEDHQAEIDPLVAEQTAHLDE